MEAIALNKEKLLEAISEVCEVLNNKDHILLACNALVFCLKRSIEDEEQRNALVYSIFDVYQPMVIEKP